MSTKTITGLYDNHEAAARTVRDLKAANIRESDISLVAHPSGDYEMTDHSTANGAVVGAETGASTGAVVGGGAGLLAGLGMLAIPGLGPVVAAGWLVATAAGAVAGAIAGTAAGGLIGSLTDAGVSPEQASVYAEGVRRGGALVTVRVDEIYAAKAETIMQRNGRIDVSDRERAYRDTGWNKFDEKAVPFTAADAARERAIYSSTQSL